MSAISSVTNSPDLFGILQNASSSSATSLDNLAADSTSADSTLQESSGHHHHHHGGGIPSQIESAVTTALQNAEPGEDPNQVIQGAIASALKNASGTGTSNDGDADDASAAGSSSSATTTSSPSTSSADFEQLLKSFGIDPKQFGQDFQSAVQSVQSGGTVDFASLFQSFPPGSAINAVA